MMSWWPIQRQPRRGIRAESSGDSARSRFSSVHAADRHRPTLTGRFDTLPSLFSQLIGAAHFLLKPNPKRVSPLRRWNALHISSERPLDMVDDSGQGAGG